MTNIQTIHQIADELKQQHLKLSEFELLSLAVQIQRNQLIENAFVISKSDNHPSGLEAIAIALGYEN